MIDDCRRSGLNASYTAVNFKPELLDLDVLAAATSAIAMSLKSGMVDLGGNHVKPLSPAVGKVWHGRTLDLFKAYKVLPFGATAAVYGFNRVSRSVHHILCFFSCR